MCRSPNWEGSRRPHLADGSLLRTRTGDPKLCWHRLIGELRRRLGSFRDHGGCAVDEKICSDERLRENEFGILDGLTRRGIVEFQPEQPAFRELLGKFYHRLPGGESWVDVIFRLRTLMDMVSRHYAGKRVMIAAPSGCTVPALRYREPVGSRNPFHRSAGQCRELRHHRISV